MKRLIINADDYGLAPGVDRGILECVRAGIVTSVSALVWKREPLTLPWELSGKAGVHLRLTDGTPLALPECVASLIDNNGRFLAPTAAHRTRVVDLDQVAVEWQLQCAYFTQGDCRPTHADCHHHVQRLAGPAQVYEERLAIASIAGVGLNPAQVQRMRARGIRCADFAEIRWTAACPLPPLLVEDFEHHETVHLMCHPGYVDAELATRSLMVTRREQELRYLLDPTFRRWLGEEGIELIGMDQL